MEKIAMSNFDFKCFSFVWYFIQIYLDNDASKISVSGWVAECSFLHEGESGLSPLSGRIFKIFLNVPLITLIMRAQIWKFSVWKT